MWWRKPKVLSVAEGYDRWAPSYHQEDNPVKKRSDEFILRSLPPLHQADVLDAGCGTGKFAITAIDRGAASVTGMDLSPAMIASAQRNCPEGRFECVDLTTAPLPAGSFDVVLCAMVLGHIPKLEPVLSKLVSALRKGGTLIVTDFHPYQSLTEAKRTFKDEAGKTFEIPHTGHTISQYFSVLSAGNLQITRFEEPIFRDTPVIFGIAGTKQS